MFGILCSVALFAISMCVIHVPQLEHQNLVVYHYMLKLKVLLIMAIKHTAGECVQNLTK